jgi:hypothetical protein
MENPLELCAALKSIFRCHAGGWLDRDTLGCVRELCHEAARAAGDAHSQVEFDRVAHYAQQLYSHRDARTDSLREQLLMTLDSIENRLYGSLENRFYGAANFFRKAARTNRVRRSAAA